MANITTGVLFPMGYLGVQAPLHASGGVAGKGPVNVRDRYFVVAPGAFSGWHKVAGVCTLDGNPVAVRYVYLFAHRFADPLRGVVTGADGSFLFDGVAPGRYTVMGIDPNGITNGVIWDYVASVPR